MRGNDCTKRPEVTREQIIKYSRKARSLLDIGCGTAQKTAFYVDYFQDVYGLEPSPDLLAIAKNWLSQSSIANLHLIEGVAENLPFEDRSFDVVSSVLSWWDAAEVSRVLKDNGVFIIERLGPKDKATFTKFFGQDESGMRGACLNTNIEEIKHVTCQKLSPYFQHIEFYDSQWETSYTTQGLWILLNNTKTTVRNFDPVKDKTAFENAISHLEVNGLITLTQNRITIVASKI